ncbi:alkaline phosphatase family protein [Alteribacillus bidgolensis]|uniref:Type I phosphodiesterase / nucleotide pyrophosphatase n=1 Tax=Alteribacillus bidgolensis TaxID=930129 RepID=A0A1G8CUA7_9BACI|nr:alkaline phosphatase family protein [Alteribacillus bidgolensis]SDH48844.1 Type I phosphodiesterase / nucleotide pyrophosphatase [Alteribacillus bidgolensis]
MPSSPSQKSVIMIMLDTLMDKPLQRALKEERIPAFTYFMEHGNYFADVVAPFPTMSVNVESTLLTGHYSDQHGVPSLVWYNKEENRIINYGTHVKDLMKLGLSKSMYDALYRLNNEHLNTQVTTIHEDLHEQGKHSASINPLVHRGKTPHNLTIPRFIRYFVPIEKQVETFTAEKFVYGRLSKLSPLKKYSRVWNKYGFNNNFSVQEFTHLVDHNEIPDFSLVYLPDHDKNVHKNGPMDTKGIKDMDKNLQTILDSFPTWEEALKNYIWILIGDNGQSHVKKDRRQAMVDIRKLLLPLKITKLSRGVHKDDQVVVANNLRSCLIYSLNTEDVPLTTIVEKLKEDDRVEIIAWKMNDWIHVASANNKETFRFKENGEMKDEYNQTWSVDGDPSILDLHIQEDNIHFGDFPDALKRLHSTLHSHQGNFVVTSVKPGYEFSGEVTPSHPGGASHGGFHKNDSHIPMVVTGTESTPESLRLVDFKNWILNLIK